MTVALLDGDIIAFRASAATQKEVNWGDGQDAEILADPKVSAEAAVRNVHAWQALARCREVLVCFTGRDNFRKRVLPTYKFNRTGKSKPLSYVYTVNAVTKEFPTQLIEGLEADDVMGILATSGGRYADAVVCTIDKDLRGVPGRHLNPMKQATPDRVDEASANRTWLMQILTGDVTDGYAGLPGVGPVKAKAILGDSGDLETMWANILKAFHNKKLTEDDALVQARVARILRRCDYDKATKEILLWHPQDPVRMPLVATTIKES